MGEVDKHFEAHYAYIEKYIALKKFLPAGRKMPCTGEIILGNVGIREKLDRSI